MKVKKMVNECLVKVVYYGVCKACKWFSHVQHLFKEMLERTSLMICPQTYTYVGYLPFSPYVSLSVRKVKYAML